MNRQRLKWQLILTTTLIVMAGGLAACTPATPEPESPSTSVAATIAYLEEQLDAGGSIPIVTISSPLTGQDFKLGQEIEVISGSIDRQGVVRVELLVDNRVVDTNQFTPQPNTEYAVKHTWKPDQPGKYMLQVQAYNPDNSIGQSQQVLVQILEPPSPTSSKTATATSSPAPSPTDTPAPPTATSIPTRASPTTTPIPDEPYLVITVQGGLNVRRGPSTRYDRIGRLNSGDRVKILGQSDIGAGRWWLISYPSASGNTGWVSASSDYSAASNTTNVAIVAAPPTPVPPTPTITPVPVPTTQQASINFGVDRTQIRAGECITFFWDVKNVKEVYFKGEGVAGNSQARRVCPPWTDFYDLQVLKLDGTIESKTIRIDVEGTAYNTIRMDIGEHVDFDRDGHVNDDDNNRNDFEWIKSNGERRFQKWNDDDDLELAPVGPESLDIIRLEDCEWAIRNLEVNKYIKPFAGLAACFRTDRGRVGKLRFEDADDDAEIQWSIWR